MDSQGSPSLFSQMSPVEDSLPDTSQDALWAALMPFAKTKGLAWVKGILNLHEQEDSGVVVNGPVPEQQTNTDSGPSRQKWPRRLANKDMPAEPLAPRGIAQPTPREVTPSSWPGSGARVDSADPQVVLPSAPVPPPPITAAPMVSAPFSLAWQVPQAAKEGIWRREFINIFSLLMLGSDGLDTRKVGGQEEQKKVKHEVWPEETIENWLRAFNIMSAVIAEKNPELKPGLFQYSQDIRKGARKWGGIGWYNYDKEFRQKMSMFPEMRWDQIDVYSWLKHMMRHIPQDREYKFTGGYSVRRHPFRGAQEGRSQRAGFKRTFSGTCRLFNAGACSWGKSCKFAHTCNKCGVSSGAQQGCKCQTPESP
ncbi:uncharacterized protein LOC144762124 isoform X2 [Lissotriton helveticus]